MITCYKYLFIVVEKKSSLSWFVVGFFFAYGLFVDFLFSHKSQFLLWAFVAYMCKSRGTGE